MNDTEKRLAYDLYEAIMDASRHSTRSEQAREFRVGVSDIGFCPERTRRMLNGQTPDDTDVLLAWIGTALGDHAEQAWKKKFPEAIVQSEVKITHEVEVNGHRLALTLTGHPDIILPEDGILLDAKTDYGLADVERNGPTDSHQYQRHQYAKAAWEGGLFGADIALKDVQVGNVWIDRAGIDKRLHVQLEPYSEEWVTGARDWLESVLYAHMNGEEAEKAPPRDMCAVVCGFFSTCRALDTDVSGLIADEDTLTRISMYREGLDLEKAGKRLKDQAKEHLRGVAGSTGEYLVRWTHINESVIPESVRRGYDKLEVRPLPKLKAAKK